MQSPVSVVASFLAFAALACLVAALVGNRSEYRRESPPEDQPAVRSLAAAVGLGAPLVALAVIVIVAVAPGDEPERLPAQPAAVVTPPGRSAVHDQPPEPAPGPVPSTGGSRVASLAVRAGSVADCRVPITASAEVDGGPATIHYRVVVNGVAGPPLTATGIGAVPLTPSSGDAGAAGSVTYSVDSPNPVSQTVSWPVVAACAAAPSAVFAIGAPDLSESPFTGACGEAVFTATATLTLTAPAVGADITYAVVVQGTSQGARTERFPIGSRSITTTFRLAPGTTSGSLPVYFSTTAGSISPTTTLTVTCETPTSSS